MPPAQSSCAAHGAGCGWSRRSAAGGGDPHWQRMKNVSPARWAGIAALLLVFLVLAGCRAGARRSIGQDAATPHDHERRTISWQGTRREYLVHVPPDARGALPLLLVLHGGGSN